MTNVKQVLGPFQKAWVDKLRDPSLTQAKGVLFDGESFCCLGVLADQHDMLHVDSHGQGYIKTHYGGVEYDTLRESPLIDKLKLMDEIGSCFDEDYLIDYLDLCLSDATSLAELNDSGFSFSKIADILEAKPEFFFKEPA